MSDTELYFNNTPPEQWTIPEYYQFRRQQSDFTGIFRWENGLLKKALEVIIRNSENDFKVERAQDMLNNLKTQLSNTRVAAFWKEIDFQNELESTKNQIELAKADGVLHIITATNKSQKYVIEAQHQDLALREPTAGKRGGRHPTEKRHRDFEEAIPDDRAKRKAGIYRGEDDRNNKTSSPSTSFNDQRGSGSGSSFSDKNTSHSQDVSLRESIIEESGVFDDEDGDKIFERMQNPLTSMEHENSAISLSDNDEDDDLIELCFPKEEECTGMIERDNNNSLLRQDWGKWAALLQEAQKKSPHKHCPENYCIIRCGAGIRLSNWMKTNIYQSLQTVLPKADRTSFVDFKSYMMSIFEEKSLKSMQQAIRLRAPPIDEPLGSKHYIIDQVFAQFAQRVFMPDNGDSDIKLSEICYNYLALWPCMYAAISGLMSGLGNLKFEPGEKNLDAIDEIRRLRHQEESHMKVDGIVYTEFNHIELLSMEVTGHYGLLDKPRAAWDHVKGSCALLAMLSRIAYIFPHGSIELFQEVKVAFVHAHAMVPSKFDEAWLLCELINFLWTLRIELLKTTKILEKLKKSHLEKLLMIQLGESCQHHLCDVLRPVTSPLKCKITTTTLNKKTEYAGAGEHVLPGSSPIRDED